MRRAVVVLLCTVVVAGCARPIAATDWPSAYQKAGGTPEQLQNDALDCHWNAKGERLVLHWPAPTKAAHADCMKEKGYTVAR